MPGVIQKLDGWKPVDVQDKRQINEEQRQNLVKIIGKELDDALQAMSGEDESWK